MSSVGRVYVGRQARSLNVAPRFGAISKVILNVTDELYYESGTNTGRTLTLTNPWGTQKMCDNILASLKGYQYQPMEAQDAILDPAAELGDGVYVKDTYTILASMDTKFGPAFRSSISAPSEEELDHEYPYKSSQERKVERQYANVRSELKVNADAIAAEVTKRENDIKEINASLEIQAGLISAKVSKKGGNNSSFGWEMTDTEMVWYASGKEVFRLDKNGAKVAGKITATSGRIGGFTIKSDHLSYNQTWGGTNSKGIYIGTDGIQLGTKFKIDNQGKLTASSGTFTGSVKAGSIKYGEDEDGVDWGRFSGSGISSGSISGSRLKSHTIGTAYTSSGINTSLGLADFSKDVFDGDEKVGYIKATYGYFDNIAMSGKLFRPVTYSIKVADGITYNLEVLGRIYE